MEKNSKNIDQFFKEELGNYTETPPPAAWDALEKKLHSNPPGRVPSAFRRYGYIAILALLVSFSAVIVARKMAATPDGTITQAQDNTTSATMDAAPIAEATTTQSAKNTISKSDNPTATNEAALVPQAAAKTETATTNQVNKNTTAKESVAIIPQANKTTNTPATTATAQAITTDHKNTVAQSTAVAYKTTNTVKAAKPVAAVKNNTSSAQHAVTNNTKRVPGPSNALSRKASGNETARVKPEEASAEALVADQIVPQAHSHTRLPITTAAIDQAAPIGSPRNRLVSGSMANPAPVETDAEEESSVNPATTTGAKKLATGAKKTVPATTTKKPAAPKQQEEIEGLNTALKHIGIGSSASPMNGKNVPQLNTPVYNNTLNAPYENKYSEGGVQVAATPAKKQENSGFVLPPSVKDVPKSKPVFDRFEMGIKAGYEKGFAFDAARKAIVSPYLQYNLSPKFSLMVQPSAKAAKVATRNIGNASSYYKVNNDGATALVESVPIYLPSGLGYDTLWVNNYSYSQTHDSIVKSNTYGGTYVEADLPILLKYYIVPKFSVYGGVNIAYGKLTGVKEHTYTSDPIMQKGDSFTVTRQRVALPEPPALTSVIRYAGTPYSTYSGPQYPTNKGATLRLGYMVGFSYEFKDKWLVDGLVQQGMAKQDVQGGYNINKTLSAAYFRFTIGYKILSK